CDKLPGARGHGEPLRLMIDLDDKVGIIDVFPHKPGVKRLLASKQGYGFVLPEEEAIAFRRAGKQVLNAGDPARKGEGAAVCLPIVGDQVAVVGDNGKILVFAAAELPEMPRGKGVKLQAYREGGLRDALVFKAEDGAAWTTADGRTRQWPEWREWLGRRAGAGKLAPKGFPATKRFRPR
uniref:DNA gyrase C-terminal beta-propeller domain-containing protein n=1 Tax=Phenylobacterium sp. TaxID=1871053 RepID=UPI00378370F9